MSPTLHLLVLSHDLLRTKAIKEIKYIERRPLPLGGVKTPRFSASVYFREWALN